MRLLQHLLWLKVRLVARSWRNRQGAVLALIGLVVGGAATLMASAALFLGVLECGPALGRVPLAMLLGSIYMGWIIGPAFGYRFNEGLDPAILGHLPVSSSQAMLGLFLGNFLDPIVLVTLPLFAGSALAGWWLGGSLFWAMVGVPLFLFHAMGTAQVVYLASLAFLKKRRAKEVLFVVLALLLLGALAALEVGVLTNTADGRIRTLIQLAEDWTWIEDAVLYTPAGLCLETMMPAGRRTVFGAGPAAFVLFLVSGVSLWVAAHYTQHMLSAGGGGDGGRHTASPKKDWMATFVHRITGSPALAGRASAECRMVLREPQYLLLYISYPIAYGTACIGAARAETTDPMAKVILIGIVVLSSVFLFTGVLFNSLAVERQGLKLAYTTPVDPLVFLIGKNLGAWTLLSLAYVVVLMVAGFGVGMPWGAAVALFLSGQVSIWVLLGLGNLGSTLAPMPLPVQGASPRQAATFGRVFTTLVVNGLGMCIGGMSAGVAWALMAGPSVFAGEFRPAPALLVLAVAWTAGLYSLSTWLGARVLRMRRDRLLEVLG